MIPDYYKSIYDIDYKHKILQIIGNETSNENVINSKKVNIYNCISVYCKFSFNRNRFC